MGAAGDGDLGLPAAAARGGAAGRRRARPGRPATDPQLAFLRYTRRDGLAGRRDADRRGGRDDPRPGPEPRLGADHAGRRRPARGARLRRPRRARAQAGRALPRGAARPGVAASRPADPTAAHRRTPTPTATAAAPTRDRDADAHATPTPTPARAEPRRDDRRGRRRGPDRRRRLRGRRRTARAVRRARPPRRGRRAALRRRRARVDARADRLAGAQLDALRDPRARRRRHDAWLLGADGDGDARAVRARRTAPAGSARPASRCRRPRAHRRSPLGAAEPLTVTADGVWIDARAARGADRTPRSSAPRDGDRHRRGATTTSATTRSARASRAGRATALRGSGDGSDARDHQPARAGRRRRGQPRRVPRLRRQRASCAMPGGGRQLPPERRVQLADRGLARGAGADHRRAATRPPARPGPSRPARR